MKTSVGLCINHDLKFATKTALQQAETELNTEPTGILYFTGSHPGGKKVYNQSLKIIKKKYSTIPLAGCSGTGIANSKDYGLKGAAIMLFSGISVSTHLIKRFRLRTGTKTKEILKKCINIENKELKQNSSTSFIFFPPGLGFPKLMVNLMNHRLEGFNPFFALNNRIWRDVPALSRFTGKIVNFLMNLFGIGISYSSAWPLFQELYQRGIHYTGTFGVDPISMNKSYQFYNYKAFKDSMTFISLSSPDLRFMSKTDTGATIDFRKPFSLDSYLDGGFIPRIDGQWGAKSLLKIYEMENTPEILEECTQKYFYYHPFKPLCILDDKKSQNLYGLSINPNLNHALITAPNQVAKKLYVNHKDKYQSYICNQSAVTIENLLDESLSSLVGNNTKFGLFFDCGNRAMIVGDRFQQYMEHYAQILGKIPYLVIISGGEVNSQSFPIVNFSLVSSVAQQLTPA
ncbi:hypothetical protein CEE45_03185 [Candidatus Heimdallarchaeota archaeon B3_Heim]|nr:MAG: hypothetical protein CEE45_03185 [Candidatus Heimdallarchaeota archaeon B3_Heim]